MEKETVFKVSSWGTVIVGIWVVFGAFDPYILIYGDFYLYLILVSGIIGIIGVIFSLGIFPVFGGLAMSAGMMYLSVLYEFSMPILFAFLKAILFIIGGCGILLTFEVPESPLSTDLTRLEIGRTEYFELKKMGITDLSQLVEEKGHEEEVASITSISVTQLKQWIKKAEEILEETDKLKKAQLQKDFKKKRKK